MDLALETLTSKECLLSKINKQLNGFSLEDVSRRCVDLYESMIGQN